MVQLTPDMGEAEVTIPRSSPPKEMMSVRKEGGKTFVRINSSSLALIQECSRKSLYLLEQKWHAETEAPATVFGSAIHKALEIFYTGARTERKLPALETMELMSYGHKVPEEEGDLCLRATRAFIEKAAPLAALPEADKRSIQNGTWILYNYFKSFLDDPYVALVDEAGAVVERSFTFRLHESDKLVVDYFGTIDLVVMHEQTGEVLVCDHKTSSVVGSDFYNRLKPNHQYTGYILGARKVLGLDTNSFLVNCLQVKAKPLTSRGTAPHFPRQVTTRDEDDFDEFTSSVLTAVGNYLQAIAFNNWPQGHVNACAMYRGCSFLAVCSAPKSLRENILKSKFVRNQ